MARFDVYRRTDRRYLLDCQADLLTYLSTRFVVPLSPASRVPKPAARLNPVFEIDGHTLVMMTQLAAAVPVRDLGKRIASVAHRDTEIGNALDMLLVGF